MLKALLIAIIIGTSTIVGCSDSSTTEETLTSKEKRAEAIADLKAQNEETTNYTTEEEKPVTEDASSLITITNGKADYKTREVYEGGMTKINGEWYYIDKDDVIKGGNTGELSFYIDNNTGLEISYIKFYIYFYDEDGNVMSTDWCNEINIPKDGSRKISTYVDFPTGFEVYEIVIDDIRF